MSRRSLFPSLAALVAAVGLAAGPAQADDTVLFSTVVAPNVVLVADNSGSMNHVVWHPSFDPTQDPTTGPGSCAHWTNDVQYNVHPNHTGDFPNGGGDTFFSPGTYTICGNTRTIFHDPEVSANNDWTRWDGRYLNWYFSDAADDPIASAIVDTSNGSFSACLGGGTHTLYRRARVTAAQEILREVICQVNAVGEVRFGLAQFRRGGDPNGGYVVVPANDYLDSTGNPNVYTLNGTSQSHGQHLDDAIDDLTGEAWTPLSETLFQVYTYFQSRNGSDRPVGQDGSTVFPEYVYRPCHGCGGGGDYSGAGAPTVPDSPVQWACQKNFVVIITDGEPTRDDFDANGNNTDRGFNSFGSLVGDFNPDGETETGVLPSEGTAYLDDIARFMQQTDFRPDLPAHAGLEQVIDVYTVGFTTSPTANTILQKTADEGNGQFYFSTDPDKLAADLIAAISDIIQKSQAFTAATVPATRTSFGGKFYNSLFIPSRVDGYWEGHLRSWTINAAGEILDRNGVCALNDPVPGRCLSGSFKPVCGPTPSPGCVRPFWDAGEVVTASTPAGRNLTASKLVAGTPTRVPFDTANISAADLAVSAADIPSYTFTPHPVPTTAAELRDALVWNVRGCELGSTAGGCVKRPWMLGDIFHSNPVVIGPPSSFRNDPDFTAFSQDPNLVHRKRVIAAGANDGFLHVFDAGTWQAAATPPAYDAGTGQEIAGFAPWEARQNLKQLPLEKNGRTQYYVDGSPSVADVWLYPSPTAVPPRDGTGASRWRTVLVGGMRQGGHQFYALDMTDPANGCPAGADWSNDQNYPCYMWEFPREDAAASVKQYMGQTWSDPIITRIKVSVNGNNNGGAGFDRYVAIVTGGYDPTGDPNDHANYRADSTAGRGIFVIDLKTGQVLAEKKFDPSATANCATNPGDPTCDPSAVAYDPLDPERSMHFALAATPGVYDIDFDGYADVIYAPDLGGNVWKWVIKDLAEDTVNGTSTNLDQTGNWDFRLFFQAHEYDDPVSGNTYWKSFFFAPSATLKSGKLWLAFGSGERMNLKFPGIAGAAVDANGEELDNNRFYAMKDLDPLENLGTSPVLMEKGTARVGAAPASPNDLISVTADASCSDVSNARGYYFVAQEGEKFVTQSDIFFYFLFVASYTPTNTVDPCGSGGLSTLYAFRIYCGEGLFTDPVTGDPKRDLDMGAGMPTDPRITIGTDGGGGGNDPNRVIINKQDGSIVNIDAPPGFGAGIGQFYWRELSQ